jgi:pyrroline-5-carboxylate reductase
MNNAVLVLGAGKMVEAILTGLKKTENLSEWMIYSPSGTSAQNLAAKVGAQFVSDLSQVKNPDWVLVGCKPQQLNSLSETLQGRFRESLFVSILAALSEEDQMKVLGVKDLIRVMPNLPVEYNEGVSLLSSVSAKTRLSSFQTLFARLGVAQVVTEEELEELTLLTGSGPAFIYEFVQNLAASFESLDQATREKLVKQVLKGSSLTVMTSKKTLTESVDAVTSKAGVTIAALTYWRNHSWKDFVKAGIDAGKARSREIRESLRK